MKRIGIVVLALMLVASFCYADVTLRVNGAQKGRFETLDFAAGTTVARVVGDSAAHVTLTTTGTTAGITSGTIAGAAINTTTVGATTPSTGKFTTLESTGACTHDTTTLNSGAVTNTSTVQNNGVVTNASTVVGPGTGYGIYTLRTRVVLSDLNSGKTLLTAVTGRKYRLIDCKIISYGANMAATASATGVAIYGTQTTPVALYTVALAQLTRSAVNRIGTASTTVLADGASFVANDAATAITVAAVGGTDLITATGADVEITYAIE